MSELLAITVRRTRDADGVVRFLFERLEKLRRQLKVRIGGKGSHHTRSISRLILPSGRAAPSVTSTVSLTATVNFPHSRKATGT